MNLFNRIIRKLKFYIDNLNDIEVSELSSIHHTVTLKGTKIRGEVYIGECSKLIKGVDIMAKSPLYIGRYTSINGPNFDLRSMVNKVQIGSFCSIGRGTIIQEFNHKIYRASSYFVSQNLLADDTNLDIFSKGSITIGNDVWIGAQCVILGGVKIGDGAVIGANSVVSNDIPPYAIAVGTPAKVVKYRFSPDIIQIMLKLKWWDWDIKKIQNNASFFIDPMDLNMLKQVYGQYGNK